MNRTTIACGLAGLLLPLAAPAAEMFSLNIWSPGKPPPPTVWSDPDNVLTLTLEPEEEAGAPGWETTGWQNVTTTAMREGRPNPFSNSVAALTINGSAGSTATFEIVNQRNMGPYQWNAVRDDSDAVHVGNATLLDGHSNTTEFDGADGGGSPFPFRALDCRITDIPFAAYDLVVYFGGNQGQFGNGSCNIRINDEIPEEPTDMSGALNFTILPGEPDGTLVEITGEGETGNYIIYRGLTGPTLHIQTWGEGFNHLGPAGMQIRAAAPATFPLVITPAVAPDAGFDLEWESQAGKLYNLHSSTDLTGGISTWDLVEGDIEATPPANTYNVAREGPRRFYVVEEFDAPPPPPLFAEGFETDNGGFTVATLGGTAWEYGAPDSLDQGGGGITGGSGGSANAWGTNLTGPYVAGTDTSLRSRVIDLTAVTAAELSFARSIDAPAGHTLEVNLIDDVTDTVIANIVPATEDANISSSAWEVVGPVAIPAEALGQAVRIEWRFIGIAVGDPYNGVYIDDVVIAPAP